MAFTLPDLPYDRDALAPHISRETLEFHHGKHHAGYVDKLNAAVEGTEHEGASLEAVIRSSDPDSHLFDVAGQHWSHSFYWTCLTPNGGGEPTGALAERIASAFGSVDKFREEFIDASVAQFGSGWGWLVDDGSDLTIMTTADADLPLAHDARALLTVDVWEHAYYLDWRNDRRGYVRMILDELVDWDFVAAAL